MLSSSKVLTSSAFILVLFASTVHASDVSDAQKAEELRVQALRLSGEKDSYRRGKLLNDAAALIQKALAANFRDAGHWLTYGNILYLQGKRSEAEQAFRRCISWNPKMAKAYNALGQLQLENGKTEEAIASFKQATKVDPTFVNGFRNLGLFYKKAGKPAESLIYYRESVKLQPDDWRAWANIVQCCQTLGELKERDQARKKVLDLAKAHKVDSQRFCREQITEGKTLILGFEYFEPKGKRAVHYEFFILDSSGNTTYRYTLEELESDTLLARQLHEIGQDEHVYALDWFDQKGTEALVCMFERKEPPIYEEVRNSVIANIRKRQGN